MNGPSDRSGSLDRSRSSLTGYRSRHRSQSHADAHDDADAGQPAVLQHPLVPPGDATLLATPDELASLLEHLRTQQRFAYDSEFIGESSYYPQLCLIQVATAERVVLIDPLQGLDLTPFWELIADPALEKIVHAGEQDLEPVTRHTGRRPTNVFDTQVAAGFAALAYPVSLAKLMNELLGVALGKGLTFTQWDARPLSKKQLRYAADDVRYLIAAHATLLDRLKTNGRLDAARAECDARSDPSRWTRDFEKDYLDLRGASTLDGRQLAVLKALFQWRDQTAREQNLPPRALMKDDVLIDLARKPPKSREQLGNVRGLPRPVEQGFGVQIVPLVQAAWGKPVPVPPRPPEPTPSQRFETDALWALVQSICAAQGIDTALLMSRHELGELHRAIRGGEDLSAHPAFTGWRGEVLGERLRTLLAGKATLGLRWDGGLRLA
jgi:ribonuclease D